MISLNRVSVLSGVRLHDKMLNILAFLLCNRMSNTVSISGPVSRPFHQPSSLYAPDGGRKYLNRHERDRVLAAAARLPREKELFVLTLAWTGARVSEVLALTRSSFQVERGLVAVRTLKRRKHHVREIPLPSGLLRTLDEHFVVAAASRLAGRRLWPWHRSTAWRIVKRVMDEAAIIGRPAAPRGFRHGFGVEALRSGVPLNLVQRWLGHASLATTAIYADASGPEERGFAERLW